MKLSSDCGENVKSIAGIYDAEVNQINRDAAEPGGEVQEEPSIEMKWVT